MSKNELRSTRFRVTTKMNTYVALVLASVAIGTFPANVGADPTLPGGDTTTQVQGLNAFSQPAANLSFEGRLDFSVGNSFFRNPWVTAPASTQARDGIGPLFNTNSCQGCHIKDGRGHPPDIDQPQLVSTLIRLSVPETTDNVRQPDQALIPDPHYGDQIQDFAIPGVEPEMRVNWLWEPYEFKGIDGRLYELRKPRISFDQLAYGDLHPGVRFSARVAPAMIGLGLLGSIPEEQIRSLADPNDINGDGISGRANNVWDIRAEQLTLGRFGWKAGQPNVEQQSAGAFFGDMGLTSSLHMDTPCTPVQTKCATAPNGGNPEVDDQTLAFVTFYAKHLAVPARPNADAPEIQKGQAIFTSVGCAQCHTPSWQTSDQADAALANQTIYPYTNLLLHDLGEGLADEHEEFDATGNEWRTAPLWGLGDYIDVNGHTQLLHDGRARNSFEAILWHGGEAATSRDNVLQLSESERELLLSFLDSL